MSSRNMRNGRSAHYANRPAHHANRPRRSSSRSAYGYRAAPSTQRLNYGLIVVLAAVILTVFAMFSVVSSCSHSEQPLQQEEAKALHQPVYDWNSLETETGRYVYYANGEKASRCGIDVSESQGYIDWQAVADDGIEFAIVRVGYRGSTEGSIYTDAMFDANIDGAINAGLDVGAYFYSQALNEEEAREEAQRCLSEINGRTLQYPIAYDLELSANHDARADGVRAIQAMANAKAFCEEVEKAGYEAAIYGNQHDLVRYRLFQLTEYPIWYAEYESLPPAEYELELWQYSMSGSVNGIDGNVDMNLDL